MREHVLREDYEAIILTYAKHNMRLTPTAKELHYDRKTIHNRMNEIQKVTGADPRVFRDLAWLVGLVESDRGREVMQI